MIDHITINVKDYQKSKDFYSKALEPLNYKVIMEFPEWNVVGFGEGEKPDFWIHGGDHVSPGHVAFSAKTREQVQAFHKTALGANGIDNGSPGPRPDYGPTYYGAFIHDLDGHNIEVVTHSSE